MGGHVVFQHLYRSWNVCIEDILSISFKHVAFLDETFYSHLYSVFKDGALQLVKVYFTFQKHKNF